MASHKKFTHDVALKILRHIDRKPKTYKNKDVDLSRSYDNTTLFDKGKEWYQERLSQVLYDKQRKDIITLCGVVVTLPQELNHLSITEQDKLFSYITEFLENRYGNGVSATVHRDEGGQPHLHYTFMPIVRNNRTSNERLIRISQYLEENPNANNTQISKALGISRAAVIRWRKKLDKPRVEEYAEKLCAREVLCVNDLNLFHKDLAKYIDRKYKGKGKLFHSGITKRQGGNKTIEELKKGNHDIKREVTREVEYTF